MSEDALLSHQIYSSYYLINNHNQSEKLDFISALIKKLQPTSVSKILSVECGNGYYARAMAKKGWEVTGINHSDEAISEAKQFENEELYFYQHDIRLPFWINYFDFAFGLFTPFQNFKTVREYNNSIRTVSQSLQKGGIFIMDFENTNIQNAQGEVRRKTVENVSFIITTTYDEENLYKRVEVEKQGITELLFAETVIKISIDNYTKILNKQGLHILEVYGNYDFSPYDQKKSPRIILFAKKSEK